MYTIANLAANGILLIMRYAQKKSTSYPRHLVNAFADSNGDLGI
jgi:hypothetical protein